MPAKYANNARSNLFSAINAGALNFSLISGGGASFPAAGGSDYFYATLIDAENIPEIIKVTSRTDDQFVVLRGQDGTVARAFAANAVVLLGITRASLEELALKDGSNATGTWSINTSGNAAMARAANSGVTSGTPTAYTLTPTAAIAAYTANLSFWVTFHSASGANPTLQISGLATPPALVRYNSAGALVGIAAGELPANFSTRVTLLNAAQALVEEMPPAVLSGPSDTALDKRPNFPNASTQIAQRAAFTTNLSTARQIGQCDNIFMWVSAGAVSAGSLTQITSAISGTSGFAARAAGVTLTGSAVLSQSIRMESRDAAKYKNRMASFQVKVDHDVGASVNYTLVVNKPTVADNFTARTNIATSSVTAVASGTATMLTFTNVSLGDVSNGLELEVQAACGAVTAKNFNVTEFMVEPGAVVTPWGGKELALELALCQRYLWVGGYGWAGSCVSSSNGNVSGTFPVTMRATPTLTGIPGVGANALIRAGGSTETITAYVNSGADKNGGWFYFGGGGYTTGSPYTVVKDLFIASSELL